MVLSRANLRLSALNQKRIEGKYTPKQLVAAIRLGHIIVDNSVGLDLIVIGLLGLIPGVMIVNYFIRKSEVPQSVFKKRLAFVVATIPTLVYIGMGIFLLFFEAAPTPPFGF